MIWGNTVFGSSEKNTDVINHTTSESDCTGQESSFVPHFLTIVAFCLASPIKPSSWGLTMAMFRSQGYNCFPMCLLGQRHLFQAGILAGTTLTWWSFC